MFTKTYLWTHHLWKEKREEKSTGQSKGSFNSNSTGSSGLKMAYGVCHALSKNDWPFIPPLQSSAVGFPEKSVTRSKAASAAEGTLKGLTSESCHLTALPLCQGTIAFPPRHIWAVHHCSYHRAQCSNPNFLLELSSIN